MRLFLYKIMVFVERDHTRVAKPETFKETLHANFDTIIDANG